MAQIMNSGFNSPLNCVNVASEHGQNAIVLLLHNGMAILLSSVVMAYQLQTPQREWQILFTRYSRLIVGNNLSF